MHNLTILAFSMFILKISTLFFDVKQFKQIYILYRYRNYELSNWILTKTTTVQLNTRIFHNMYDVSIYELHKLDFIIKMNAMVFTIRFMRVTSGIIHYEYL